MLGGLLAVLLGVLCLDGCSREWDFSRVVFTTGFGRDEVFRIGRSTCTLPEFMVYLVNTQNQYEAVYGEQIWEVELDGVTLADNVKDTVLAKLAQIKTMYLMARERDVELEEGERQRVETAAQVYYDSLTDRERQVLGVDREIIRKLYTEYAMAEKLYNQIIEGINPEISDDEARTITVEHILIRAYTTDGTGRRIDYSEDMKKECYQQITELRERVVDGGEEFAELAAKYSQDENLRYSFRKVKSPLRWRRWPSGWKTGRSAKWWNWRAAIICSAVSVLLTGRRRTPTNERLWRREEGKYSDRSMKPLWRTWSAA